MKLVQLPNDLISIIGEYIGNEDIKEQYNKVLTPISNFSGIDVINYCTQHKFKCWIKHLEQLKFIAILAYNSGRAINDGDDCSADTLMWQANIATSNLLTRVLNAEGLKTCLNLSEQMDYFIDDYHDLGIN